MIDPEHGGGRACPGWLHLAFVAVAAIVPLLVGTPADQPDPVTPPVSGAETAPRESIHVPEDCGFRARAVGAAPDLAEICAENLMLLQRAINASFLREECEDMPDLEAIPLGVEADDRFSFHPLGGGRFVIAVRCQLGAYNETALSFVYDESRGLDTRATEPQILVFPQAEADGGGFTWRIWYRSFSGDPPTLYDFRKAIGDGSGGRYNEYLIDPVSFVPSLIMSIGKSPADYRDGYDFEVGLRPAGPGWIPEHHDVPLQGCISPLSAIDYETPLTCP